MFNAVPSGAVMFIVIGTVVSNVAFCVAAELAVEQHLALRRAVT